MFRAYTQTPLSRCLLTFASICARPNNPRPATDRKNSGRGRRGRAIICRYMYFFQALLTLLVPEKRIGKVTLRAFKPNTPDFYIKC